MEFARGVIKQVKGSSSKRKRKEIEDRIKAVCDRHGVVMDDALVTVQTNRKIAYVLNPGVIDRPECFDKNKQRGLIVFPHNFKVVFESNRCVWVGHILYQHDPESNTYKRMFEATHVTKTGREEFDKRSYFQSSPSSAYKEAYKKATNTTLTFRPNGQLLFGVKYPEPQAFLQQTVMKNPMEYVISADPTVIQLAEQWMSSTVDVTRKPGSSLSLSTADSLSTAGTGSSRFSTPSSLQADSQRAFNLGDQLNLDVLSEQQFDSSSSGGTKRNAESLHDCLSPHENYGNYGEDMQRDGSSRMTRKLSSREKLVSWFTRVDYVKALRMERRRTSGTNSSADKSSPAKPTTIPETASSMMNDEDLLSHGMARVTTSNVEEAFVQHVEDVEDINFESLIEEVTRNEERKVDLYCHMEAEGLFMTIGMDKEKAMSEHEFENALRTFRLPMDSGFARATFRECDTNGDGKVDMNEFVAFLKKRETQLKELFDSIDINKDGTITKEELVHARGRGELGDATDEDIDTLIDWMDNLKFGFRNNMIDFEEFRTALMLLPPATTLEDVIHSFHGNANESDLGLVPEPDLQDENVGGNNIKLEDIQSKHLTETMRTVTLEDDAFGNSRAPIGQFRLVPHESSDVMDILPPNLMMNPTDDSVV